MKTQFTPFLCLLILGSCQQQQDRADQNIIAPKVVEAKGYVVPQDSMATPKVIVVDETKLKKIPAGKPKVVPSNPNVHPAGTPKIVLVGKPRICTPGKDTFSLPKTVTAIGRSVVAGMPEVVLVKPASTRDPNPYGFSIYGKLQGLKHDAIGCIRQDRLGNIWFATSGGATKYDGKNFIHFTEKEGLVHNSIVDIFEDHAGNMWFATDGYGVSKYDGKTFTHFTEKEGLSHNSVLSIFEDHTGNIWFGTGKGVSKFNGESFTHFTEKQGLSHNLVIDIVEDRAGNMWFGTYGGGVSKYNGKSFSHFTTKEGLSHNLVFSITEDHAGNMWFGTLGGGVSKYDGKSFTHFTRKEGLSHNMVYSILEDCAENIWFATYGGGVSKYDGKSFTHFTNKEGLSHNTVYSILETNSGHFWFGTAGGVSKFYGQTFTHFTEKEGLSNNDVQSILEDPIGNIWFGTRLGVSKYDGKSFIHFTEKEGLVHNLVTTEFEDHVGNIWFGTGLGVSKYDGKSFTHFTEKEGLPWNYVNSITEDHLGNIWFGTYGEGASKYDGKSFTHYAKKEGLSHNVVSNIVEDHTGNIWFGTYGGGVSKYDGRTFTHFTEKEGLLHHHVSSILEDHAGNMWFGTYGGVSKYDGKFFTHFTEKEGLSNNNVLSILEDHAGNMWFGTRFGLSMLGRVKLAELSEGLKSGKAKDHDALFKNYTYEDGFLGIGCISRSILEAKDGTIWIGANDRLTAFHPSADKAIADTLAPNIQLTGLELFNEPIPWVSLAQHKDSSITLGNGVKVGNFKFKSLSKWYSVPEDLSLAYTNNFLTFNFIGITQFQPEKVKYQYKLVGFDQNWSGITSRTDAPYGNLPPGTYTFKVKAMNSAGYWSKESNYTFTIRPPWYQTWWAYTLYVLSLLGGIWGYVTYRSAALRRANQVLEAKVKHRTDQLNQSLENLKATQNQLIQSEKMASLGELTAGIAHEIQNPLNFVNNFSELNTELIDELLEEMDKGNLDDAKDIATDIKDNEQKINHHGQRASGIVKGMLEHSRSSSGTKAPTDLNALVDEYLRLAYHGFRAMEKDFNAALETHFDESIPNIEVIPQDIGRVLLNLINNAFYACAQKAGQGIEGYTPNVRVSTKQLKNAIQIRIKDNGNGIPQKIIDKIFQPFFTTKPPGQGTGLGLSLSFDIIKGHGGEISVESVEGEFTEFIIELPL